MGTRSPQANLVMPKRLKERIQSQIELTGENQSEFIRRCLL